MNTSPDRRSLKLYELPDGRIVPQRPQSTLYLGEWIAPEPVHVSGALYDGGRSGIVFRALLHDVVRQGEQLYLVQRGYDHDRRYWTELRRAP